MWGNMYRQMYKYPPERTQSLASTQKKQAHSDDHLVMDPGVHTITDQW